MTALINLPFDKLVISIPVDFPVFCKWGYQGCNGSSKHFHTFIFYLYCGPTFLSNRLENLALHYRFSVFHASKRGFVEEWLRDLAALAAGAPRALLNQDRLSELEEWLSASQIEAFNITSAFGAVDRARELARKNVNPQLIVSGLVGNLREILQGHSPRGVMA